MGGIDVDKFRKGGAVGEEESLSGKDNSCQGKTNDRYEVRMHTAQDLEQHDAVLESTSQKQHPIK